jgi:hypothetical protein
MLKYDQEPGDGSVTEPSRLSFLYIEKGNAEGFEQNVSC